jgi:hypothetical protein
VIKVTCSCGEILTIRPDDQEGDYRVQHGPNPEHLSPVIHGRDGERSFEWRHRVHGRQEVSA